MAKSPQTPLDVILTSKRLPSPSGVALQILELTQNEYASGEDLQRVLIADPALSGQLLKYANSALVRGSTEVRTVSEAVVRLGMSTVRQLALGFSLLSGSRSGPCPGFDYNGFWSRSLATGVAARCLAPLLPDTFDDEAFTCGLLGQIGELCLASVHARDYAGVLERWDGHDDQALLEIEHDVLMTDHDQVTAALFTSWGLPEFYAETIVAQRKLDNEGPNATGLARVVGIARDIARICVAGEDKRPALAEILLQRSLALGLANDSMIAATEQTTAEWARMGEVLDILTEDVPSLIELAERSKSMQPGPSMFTEDGLMADNPPEPVTVDNEPDEPLRILVVDDSPLDRKIVASHLTSEDYHVEIAENGRDGLAVVLRWNPHIIITDWMMPEMTGLDLCRSLRQSDETGNVYVMMMTSSDQQEDLETALDAGADDYIPKPINHAVLVARLRAAGRLIRLQERAERDREAIQSFAAELSVANRKLQHLALYDTLTGLPNRRYAMDRLTKEWDRSRRQDKPLLCMILDIDHFKNVNDTHGHDTGDVVLERTAGAMQECLRSSDDVCRFGGEEFLCICPDADLTVARELGDRLRAAVERNHIKAGTFDGNVTVSIGVAGTSPDVESIHDMLKLADEALYAAKDAGRNKVCIVDPTAVG